MWCIMYEQAWAVMQKQCVTMTSHNAYVKEHADKSALSHRIKQQKIIKLYYSNLLEEPSF